MAPHATEPHTPPARPGPERDLLLALIEGMGLGLARVELVRDTAGDAVDVRLLELDAAFHRMVAVPPAIAEGRTIREVAPKVDGDWVERFDRVVRTGRPERITDGAPVRGHTVEILAHPAGGDRLMLLYADITDRMRADGALRASEEHQTFMLRLSDMLRPLEDPEEIQDVAARELGVRLAASRVFYFTVEPGGGGPVHVVEREHFARPGAPSMVGRHARAAFGGFASAGLADGHTWVCRDIGAARGGAAAPRDAAGGAGARAFLTVPLVKGGRYVGGMCLADDAPRTWTRAEIAIAEQTAERTWAALERGRAVAAAARERDVREAREREFVANAAHDLRTPLTGIVSAVDALDAGAKCRPEDRDRFLAHIRREADRMGRLCDSLMLLTRIDATVDVPRRRVAVREVLAHVAAGLAPRPGVEVEVDASPAATVVSHAGLLERIVANLAGNAVKCTPSGRIVLHAARLREVVVVEVRDTGVGISPDIAGRVFDRFFRGGDRSRDGFGLGLSIAGRAATVLGGTLELLRPPEGGTVARLMLPDEPA